MYPSPSPESMSARARQGLLPRELGPRELTCAGLPEVLSFSGRGRGVADTWSQAGGSWALGGS